MADYVEWLEELVKEPDLVLVGEWHFNDWRPAFNMEMTPRQAIKFALLSIARNRKLIEGKVMDVTNEGKHGLGVVGGNQGGGG